MARRNEIDPSVGAFAEVAPPNPQEMAQMLAKNDTPGPVAMPEEAKPRAAQPDMMRVSGRRSIKEIVDAFIAEIATHPDAKILGTTLNEIAEEAERQCFPGEAPSNLRVDKIALIRRMGPTNNVPEARPVDWRTNIIQSMWAKPEKAPQVMEKAREVLAV